MVEAARIDVPWGLDRPELWDGFWSSLIAAVIGGVVSLMIARFILRRDAQRAKADAQEARSMEAAGFLIVSIVDCAEGFMEARDQQTNREDQRKKASRSFVRAVRGRQHQLASDILRQSADSSRVAAGQYRKWCDKRDAHLMATTGSQLMDDPLSQNVFNALDAHLVSVRKQLEVYQQSGKATSNRSIVPFVPPPSEQRPGRPRP